MDEKWKQTLEDFSRVWPRVGGAPPPGPVQRPEPHRPPPPPPPPRSELEDLAGLIRMETGAMRLYQTMAGKLRGGNAAAWRRLAGDSRRMVQKLQSEYYLRTGDSCPVPRTPVKTRGPREELRRAWQDAGQAERSYLEAADRAKDAGLRAVYTKGAELKRGQREELRALCEQMFR